MADATHTPVVDTHVHAGTTKYEPVESLLDQMARHRIDHAVLVQHMGMFDNDYLIACAEAHPGRFAIACLVDVHEPGAASRLDALVERHPAVQGIRLYLADLFAGVSEARALWDRADALGLNITVAGTLAQLASDEMQATARRYTRARLHLEHLCHPDPKEEAPYPSYRRALSLADVDQCLLKVSGFYSFTTSPWSPYVDTLRFVDLSLEAFGPARMMWGSDFPPVSGREGYGNAIAFARHHMAIPDPTLRAHLLGGTATRFWNFHTEG
jgi:L-fuconolactonase